MNLTSTQESRKLLSSSLFTAPLCLELSIRELYIFFVAKSEDSHELLNSFCLLVGLLFESWVFSVVHFPEAIVFNLKIFHQYCILGLACFTHKCLNLNVLKLLQCSFLHLIRYGEVKHQNVTVHLVSDNS
jgi:hypothetical protein